MKKDTIFTLIRTALTAFGAFLIGKNLFGSPLDSETWQTVVGFIVTAVSVVWGFIDKSTTLEAFQSFIRQVFTFVGGFLVASGRIKAELLEQILGVVLPLSAFIYSILSKQKTANLITGKFVASTDYKGKDVVKKTAA